MCPMLFYVPIQHGRCLNAECMKSHVLAVSHADYFNVDSLCLAGSPSQPSVALLAHNTCEKSLNRPVEYRVPGHCL